MALGSNLTVALDANVGIVAETVSGDMATHAWQQFTHHRIVNTHHRTAVERQVVQKVNKRLLQVFEVALVGLHMVGFDIGDNRHHRLQMQERSIALIRFRNQVTAGAQTRMSSCRFHQPAVNKGRVQTGFGINARHHCRGRGLAMRTGNGDAVTKTHQFGQHLCAADYRNTRFAGGDNFRVVGRNRGRNHDYAGIQYVLRAVMEVNRRPERAQLLGYRIRCQVGTADLITFIGQHFGDTTHAGATDADKVNVPDASHLGHDST